MSDEIKVNYSLIKAYGQDGKFSKEELEILKQTGINQEILDALSGAKSQREVNDIADKYLKLEYCNAQKAEYNDTLARYDEQMANANGFREKAGVWAAKAEYKQANPQVNQGGFPLVPILVKAAIGLLAMAGVTSCQKGDDVLAVGGTTSTSNTTVNVIIEEKYERLEKLVKEWFEQYKKDKEVDTKNWEEMKKLIESLKQSDQTLAQILKRLEEQCDSLDAIVDLFIKQGETLTDIADALQEMGKDTKEIVRLLKENGATLSQILVAVKDNNEILKYLAGNNQEILEKLKVIIGLQEDHGAKFEEHSGLLDAILKKITEFSSLNGESFEDIKNMMLNYLQSFNDFVTNEYANDKEQSDLLKVLIEHVKTGNKNFMDFAVSIQGHITTFEKNVIQAIKDLVPHMDKLTGDVINAIKDVVVPSDGKPVDLSKLETMVAKLLEQTATNGDILESIDSKLGVVTITLESLKNIIPEGNEKLLKKLQEILDKIPAGCNCKDIDLTVLLQKLDEIIKNLKTNGNHEGILDDLDNYLG